MQETISKQNISVWVPLAHSSPCTTSTSLMIVPLWSMNPFIFFNDLNNVVRKQYATSSLIRGGQFTPTG
jgi:hypothetical protein